MPKLIKLDNFLLLAVTLLFTFSSLSSTYFSYEVYMSNRDSKETQSKDLLVLQNKDIDEGKVLAGCPGCFSIGFYLKVQNTNTIITSATAELMTKEPFDTPFTWIFEYIPASQVFTLSTEMHDLWLKDGYSLPSFVSVKITKSGYQSITTAIPTSLPGTVYLIKTSSSSPTPSPADSSSSSPSSDSSSSSTGTTIQTKVAEEETLYDVLPSIFKKKGSKTTNLAKVSDLSKVRSLTLDVAGKNMIVFKEPVDLSSEETAEKLKNLDKYVRMDTVGKVGVDSKALPVLNKKASITMSGLKFVSEPEVLVDSKKDTKKVISNLLYNKEKGTLTFNVAHFSNLWAVPKLELLEPATTSIKESIDTIKGRISDPTTVITGRLNEVNLANYTPDEKTGEFVIDNTTLQEGENFLTLEAESAIYKILPLVTTLTYTPTATAATVAEKNYTHYVLLLVSSISALIFLILVGYLVYRKRKYFAKADTAAKPQVLHA